MSEKLCIFCKHFSFENHTGGEYPEGASAHCCLGHYEKKWTAGDYGMPIWSEADLRTVLLFALDCPDYAPPEPPK